MTAPVQDPPQDDTAGYLMCRNRRYGCEWSAVFRTFADEPDALEIQRIHHLICPQRPDELMATPYPWQWSPDAEAR